jgi:hypothetical protein
MRKTSLILLFGIFYVISLAAQETLFFKEVNANKIGLSTMHMDLLEDAHGNLWDGTLKGLYLFDGEKSILIKDSSNQINSQANILAAINDDSIMVGIDHGLGIATKKKLIPLDFSFGVWGLLQVAKNKVFIGSRNGLYLWENGKIKQIPGTEKTAVSNLVMNTKDCIYFSGVGKIFRYKNDKVELVTNTAAVTSKLYINKQNVLYFADTSLHKIVNGNIAEVFHPKNTITSIKESANGNLLVCASSLYELGENFVHELFSLPIGKGERITKTMYDKTGRLWLLSNRHIFYQSEKIYDDVNTTKGNIILYSGYSDSLYRILMEEHGTRLLNINGNVKPLYDARNEEQTKYAARTMFDFFFVSAKEFYLVDGRGYQYFNDKKVSSIVFNPNYDLSYRIHFAAQRNQIWLHTLMGPALLNGDKYILFNKTDYKDRTIENIASILPDSNNNWVWFGSFTGDFGYLDVDKNKYVLLDTIIGLRKDYKEKTRIFSVLSDKQNNLWVYAEHKGLYKIVRNGNDPKKFVCKLWDANASLGEYKFDSNGNLWAILDEGVKVYQAGVSGVPENPLLFKLINPLSDLDGVKTEDITLSFDNQNDVPNQFTLYGNTNHVYQFHLDKLFHCCPR